MNNRQLTLHDYIVSFRKILAEKKIEMAKFEMADGLLEDYILRTENKTWIGEISYSGVLLLGDMKLHVEKLEAWQEWQREKYPHVALFDALRNEVDKAIAGVTHKHRLFGVTEVVDAQTIKIEQRLGIGKM